MRQDAPPSSVIQTPAALTPTASREGSPGQGQIEWRASPPAPGCQSPARRSFHNGSFSAQVAPSSRLSNNAACATPAQSCPGVSPGLTTQMRSIEESLPSGMTGPSAWVHSPAGSPSVKKSRGP